MQKWYLVTFYGSRGIVITKRKVFAKSAKSALSCMILKVPPFRSAEATLIE